MPDPLLYDARLVPRLNPTISTPMGTNMSKTELENINSWTEGESSYSPVGTINRESIPGLNQSDWSRFGHGLSNILINGTATIAELVASTSQAGGNRLRQLAFKAGLIDENIPNMQMWQAPWRDALGKIHLTNPEDEGTLGGDQWIANLWKGTSDTMASALGFAVPGGAIGKAAAYATEALLATKALSASVNVAKLIRGASWVGSSAVMTHIESIQVGQQVYNDNLEPLTAEILRNNPDLSYDDAKEQAHVRLVDASNSAKYANTILNTGLNMFMMSPFFKHAGRTVKQELTEGFEEATKKGFTPQQWLNTVNRNKKAAAQTIASKNASGTMRMAMMEAPQEALEELNNAFTAEAYKRQAFEDDSRRKGFLDTLMDIGTYGETVASPSGIYSAVMGAIGGAGTTTIMHAAIPYKSRVPKLDAKQEIVWQTDENGRQVPVTEERWVTNRKRDKLGYQMEYVSAINALAEDMARTQKALADIKTETNPARKQQLMEQAFSANALASVELGRGDLWKNTYRSIAELDNTEDYSVILNKRIANLKAMKAEASAEDQDTYAAMISAAAMELQAAKPGVTEAMASGYAVDKNDNNYKIQAKKGIERIEHVEQVVTEMQNKYKHADETTGKNYSGFMASRKLMIEAYDSSLKDIEDDVRKAESVPSNTNRAGIVSRDLSNYHSAVVTSQQLSQDLTLLKEYLAGNIPADAIKSLLEQYKIGPVFATKEGVANVKNAINDLGTKLAEANLVISNFNQIAELTAEDAFNQKEDDPKLTTGLETLTEYRDWLKDNVGGDFNDFVEDQRNQDQDLEMLGYLKSERDLLKIARDIAEAEFNRLDSSKGLKQFQKNVATYEERNKALMRKMQIDDELEELVKEVEAAAATPDGSVLATAREAKLNEVRGKMTAMRLQLEDVTKQLSNFPVAQYFTNFEKYVELSTLKRKLQSILTSVARSTGMELTAKEFIPWSHKAPIARIDDYIRARLNNGNAKDAVTQIYGADFYAALELAALLRVVNYNDSNLMGAENLRLAINKFVPDATVEEIEALWRVYADVMRAEEFKSPEAHYAALVELSSSVSSVQKLQEYIDSIVNDVLSVTHSSQLLNLKESINETFDYSILDEDIKNDNIEITLATALVHAAKNKLYNVAMNRFRDLLLMEGAETGVEKTEEDIEELNELIEELNNPQPLAMNFQGWNDHRLDTIESFNSFSSPLHTRLIKMHTEGKPITPGKLGILREELLEAGFVPKDIDTYMEFMFSAESLQFFNANAQVSHSVDDVLARRAKNNGWIVQSEAHINAPSDILYFGAKAGTANKGNSPTIENIQLVKNDPVTGQAVIRFYSIKESIIMENLERIRKLKPNQEVFLRIHQGYTGTGRVPNSLKLEKNNDKVLNNVREDNSFYRYTVSPTDPRIREDALEDFPIGIYIQNEDTGELELVSWYPTTKWILDSIPNATNYSHQQGSKELDSYGTNWAIDQANENRRIRAMLLEAHNSNPTEAWQITTRLSSPPGFAAEPGKFIQNYVFSASRSTVKLVQDKFQSLIASPNLAIGIGAPDGVGVVQDKRGDVVVESANLVMAGAPYAVTEDWDGRSIAIPMTMDFLSAQDAATVVGMINAFRTRDAEAGDIWLAKTGFDILTPAGLRNAMQQYFTWVETESLNKPYYADQHAIAIFDTGTIQIKAPNSMPISLKMENVAMTEQVTNALIEVIRSRRISVLYDSTELKADNTPVIKGVRANAPYVHPKFVNGKFKFDGKLQQFESYNDYLTSRATTTVYGLNQTADGKYIYTANPMLPLAPINTSPQRDITAQVTSVVPKDTGEEVETPQVPADIEGFDELSFDDALEMRWPTTRNDTIETIPVGAVRITESYLKELSTLAGNNHTGLSVQEVWDEFQRQGRTFIPRDKNPFRRCP